MAYGSASGIAALTPHLVVGGSSFKTTTRPTLIQVEAFLDDGAALMDMEFAGLGFTVPVTNATAKLVLAPVNEFYGASFAEAGPELGRAGPPGDLDETFKDSYWWRRYRDAMDKLTAGQGFGLELIGASRGIDVFEPHAGGLSVDEKDEHWDDDDFVKPAFWSRMRETHGRKTETGRRWW